MNVVDYLLENARDLEEIAMLMDKTETSYGELGSRIRAVQRFIREHDAGENILILADNSPFFVEAYIGIMADGRVVVPMLPRSSEPALDFVIKSCNITTAFVQKKYIGKITEKYHSVKNIVIDLKDEKHSDMGSLDGARIDPVDVDMKKRPAVIVFTSGSTGDPRGVIISHNNLKANTESIVEYLELTSKDRVMAVMPFSYCYGASLLHTHLRVGGSIVINNRFMFPGKVLEEINEKRCTGFAGVPSHFQILLRKTKMKEMTFPALKYVTQAGGKLPTPFISELIKALPTTNVIIMYGQTEATARLSYLPTGRLKDKLGSMGKGIPGVKLEVLDKEGRAVKPGEVGEIVASGENIMMGYWQLPEETAKVLRNGRLYTGDLATVDEDGFIFVVDREKQIIKCGGYRVSPKEIEDVIVTLPEVVEAAAIGVPDEILGEGIKAFVTLKDPRHPITTEKDVIDLCKRELPSYKCPKHVEFVDGLPKNDYGKVMKEELKRREAKG